MPPQRCSHCYFAFICSFIYIYIYLFIYLFVFIFIYIYIYVYVVFVFKLSFFVSFFLGEGGGVFGHHCSVCVLPLWGLGESVRAVSLNVEICSGPSS